MGHRLRGIPPSSHIVVYAMARFPQWKGGVDTGGLQIVATAAAYPLKISVRPNHTVQSKPGAFKNYGKMMPDGQPNPAGFVSAHGHDIDFMIQSPDEFKHSDTPDDIKTRRHDWAMVICQPINPDATATDIYQRLLCDKGCGALPSPGKTSCDVCVPPLRLCTAARATPLGISECPNPVHGDLPVCFMHAKERGLVSDPLPELQRVDLGDLQKRKRAPHKDGCKCVSCTRRRAREERAIEAGSTA